MDRLERQKKQALIAHTKNYIKASDDFHGRALITLLKNWAGLADTSMNPSIFSEETTEEIKRLVMALEQTDL